MKQTAQTVRHYLLGRHFEIASDHQPLCWLHKMKEPNAKLTRWKFRLAEYDFDIKYVKGKENQSYTAQRPRRQPEFNFPNRKSGK